MLAGLSPRLRTLVFTVFVPGFWIVLVPYWVVGPGARLSRGGFLPPPALRSTVSALSGALRCVAGTPAPIDPPKKLVAEGPYRIVRNPMYGSVVFVIVGEALAFRSVALPEIGCVFFAFTALFVILHEEPRLRNKFGAEYET